MLDSKPSCPFENFNLQDSPRVLALFQAALTLAHYHVQVPTRLPLIVSNLPTPPEPRHKTVVEISARDASRLLITRLA